MREKDIQDYTEKFQRGEEDGFTYFFNSLQPALNYYAFRILNDKSAAEDIVEESFVKIWERHSSFNHHQVIKSWMYTTVRNGCLNKIQQDQRRNAHKEMLAAELTEEDDDRADYNIMKRERIVEARKYIKMLPVECARIFHLLYVEGLEVRDVANRLGLSISTIKNQKYRGLGIIREIIEGNRPIICEQPVTVSEITVPETVVVKSKEKPTNGMARMISKELFYEMRNFIKSVANKVHRREDTERLMSIMTEANAMIIQTMVDDIDGDMEESWCNFQRSMREDGISTGYGYRRKQHAFREFKIALEFDDKKIQLGKDKIKELAGIVSKYRVKKKRILGYIISGLTHEQVCDLVGMSSNTLNHQIASVCNDIAKFYPHPLFDEHNERLRGNFVFLSRIEKLPYGGVSEAFIKGLGWELETAKIISMKDHLKKVAI